MRNRHDLHMKIDPVQQRAGYLVQIFIYGSRRTATFSLIRVIVIATGDRDSFDAIKIKEEAEIQWISWLC